VDPDGSPDMGKAAALRLRAPLPGYGHQGLHPDFEQRRTEGPWQTLSAMWCITAFTPDNGPPRVIPGSHPTRPAADRHAGVRIGEWARIRMK
jgi:ectoine hydroxylase-related dioxygenase (phytanoyl-CoA dioxygenase family)